MKSVFLQVRQKGGHALLLPVEFLLFLSVVNRHQVARALRNPVQALYFSRNWSTEKCVATHAGLSLLMYTLGLSTAVLVGGMGAPAAAIAVNPHVSIMLKYGLALHFLAYLPVAVMRLVVFDSIGYQLGQQGFAEGKAARMLQRLERLEARSKVLAGVANVVSYGYLFVKNSFTAMLIMGARGKRWGVVLAVNVAGTTTVWSAVYFTGPAALAWIAKIDIPYVPMI